MIPCNWRFPAENFSGDRYHVQWSHLSAIPTGLGSGVSIKPSSAGSLVSPGNGHCLVCFGPQDVPEPPIPELLAYSAVLPAYRRWLQLMTTKSWTEL
jgi:hypothetical protein